MSPAVRIIPCLDVCGGRVVKGVRFQQLRDVGDPVEAAQRYEGQGADEITLLDVSATIEARESAADTVARVRASLRLPMTVGGGVRTVDDALRLLDAGADKVSVNTAAVQRPELVQEIAARFGSQCAVVAIDAAERKADCGWEVVVRSGRERTGVEAATWASRVESLGAGEILLTSWDRDGVGAGYDIELISSVRSKTRIPIIASGGGRHAAHMAQAVRAGADAVLAASIFHDGALAVGDVKRELASMGVEVRL